MSDELTVSARGLAIAGWSTVQLVRSLEQLSDTFHVAYAARATENREPLAVVEGDACVVKVGDDEALTGYVDDAEESYDAEASAASMSGRSLGDLVDCAAVYKTGAWKNASLTQIARDLCEPFDVGVDAAADVGKVFRGFALQDGETVFEALDRAARMRGLLLRATGAGGLQLTRAGAEKTRTVLRYGENVLAGARRGSWKDRYSTYTVKAQVPGDDEFFGQKATQIKASADDAQVNRYRPTVVQAENEDSGRELQDRATWERNVRAGRSRRLTYKVRGWRDEDGALWAPNVLVRVDDTRLRIRDELLVVTATLAKTLGEGTTTTLELTAKEAFLVQPLPPPKPPRNAKSQAALFDFKAAL